MVNLPTLCLFAGVFTLVGDLIILMIGIGMGEYEDVLGAHIVVKNRIQNSKAQAVVHLY